MRLDGRSGTRRGTHNSGGTEGAKIAVRRKHRGLLLNCGFRCF